MTREHGGKSWWIGSTMVPDAGSSGYRYSCNCGWTGCPEICVTIKTHRELPVGKYRVGLKIRKKDMQWAERRKYLLSLRP